jgi:hypothetical protein
MSAILGSLDPYWTHVILLSVAALASIAVGVGIVMESPHWSVANALVVGGVAIEAICTFVLFGFDEEISNKQQRIIEQLLAPRKLSVEQKNRISEVAKQFPNTPFIAYTVPEAEPWNLVLEISAVLKENGWNWKPFPALGIQALDGRPSEGTTIVDHIEIQGSSPPFAKATNALANAIRDPNVIGMDDVRVVIGKQEPDDPEMRNVVNVIVGSKR